MDLNSFPFCRLKSDKTFYRVTGDKIKKENSFSKTINLTSSIFYHP